MIFSFAHGMYIDDILWFVIPVGLSLWLLRWAERKARARAEADEVQPEPDPQD
ncbi:MAG: hypothetical protein WD532_00175 [Acidimicrobiia bacterium]